MAVSSCATSAQQPTRQSALPPADPEVLQMFDVVAEEPDAGPVSAAAAAAALDGSPRWVPYLVDVVPLVFDEGALVAIFGALEALSGLPAPEDRVEAHVAFGSWMISRRLSTRP